MKQNIFPMTVKGQVFNSFREIEAAFDLPAHCSKQRYKRGRRGDELAKPARKSATGKNDMATIKGETKPVVEWLKIYGISRKLFCARHREHGWSVEDAITVPKGVMTGINYSNARYVEHNGERLRICEIARKLGLSQTAIRLRIEHGWTPEQICTEPNRKFNNIKTRRDKGRHGKLAKAALTLGMRTTQVSWRINKLGWTEEQATTLPPHCRIPSVEKKRQKELALLGIII